MRCPQGKKAKLYKHAKLEKFAHYLMKDGLVCRLSMYEDKECKSFFLGPTLVWFILELKDVKFARWES